METPDRPTPPTPEPTAPPTEATEPAPETPAPPVEPASTATDVTVPSALPPSPDDQPTTPGHLPEPPQPTYWQPTTETPAGYPTYTSQYGPQDPSVAAIPVVPYNPASPQTPYNYAPPPPPKPPGPPKSVLGATLLNLTGLGLGYAYLRNRVLFAIALVATAGLITVAFLTGAAQNPMLWRIVALGWVGVLALHAFLLARRRQPGPRTATPIIAGAVAVALLAAGYVGYSIAGGSTYDDGVAAQKAGDCATATSKFDSVTGPFELTLSSDVLDAADRRDECAFYTDAVSAQKQGNLEQAITRYHDFGKIYPDSVLGTFVHKNLADTYFKQATEWKEPLSAEIARSSVDTLLMLQREYEDTAVVEKVPDAIAKAFAAANKPYADGKFCDALPVLDYFSGLDASSAGEVVPTATANRGRALYECGLSQLRGNAAAAAVSTLELFVTGYPKDGGVPQARAALITAKVAAAAGVQLPVPPPLGDNNPGSIPVTFYNDSSDPLTILVAGPTAHELTLPGCAVCPADYAVGAPEACSTFDGRPAVTMRLTPAQYYFTTVRTSQVNSYTDSVTPLVGYEHTQCLYVEQI